MNKRSSSFLHVSHVSLGEGFLNLFLYWSKTLLIGKGHWVSLANSTNPVICPVSHVSRYLSSRHTSNDSFFIHQDLSSLTRYQFSAVLASCLKRLKLPGFCFSSHSFRIGVATTAYSLGFSADVLKKLGRWDSDRYKIYVRPDLLTLLFYYLDSPKSNIWIVGHSYVFWAAKHARTRTYSSNLGLNANEFSLFLVRH